MDKDVKKSSVKKLTFKNRLFRLFGFQKTDKRDNSISAQLGVEQVVVNNEDEHILPGASATKKFYDQKVGRLLESYLKETSLSYDDVQDRKERIAKLDYMYCNDANIKRVCDLVADEATQLDQQNRLISCECEDKSFIYAVYQLFNRWGLTQEVLYNIAKNLQKYGEAFLAHPIDENGVVKIKTISPATVIEKLEFDGQETAKKLAQTFGKSSNSGLDRTEKIKQIIDQKEGNAIASIFDNMVFGYELEGNIFLPPWAITHFRLESEEFYPYGRPPLLECFSAFDQCYTSYAMQALARSQSFPVKVFKVKGMKSGGPGKQVEFVNSVREHFDNLAAMAANEGSEPFTLNTTLWIPEDLVSVDSLGQKTDYNFTGDLELLENRVAFCAGVPKAYLDGTFNGFGASGLALTQQYKPFARHVFTIQSALLQGLGELIRLHFAINGQFDYNTQFVLKMNFPALETDDSVRTRQTASLELSKAVIDTIKTAIGYSEEEPLPQEVAQDILSKYSFIDPTQLATWYKQSVVSKANSSAEGEEPTLESTLSPAGKLRLKEITRRYENVADSIYLNFLQEQALTNFQNSNDSSHAMLVRPIDSNTTMYEAFNFLLGKKVRKHNLRETSSVKIAENFHVPEALAESREDVDLQ